MIIRSAKYWISFCIIIIGAVFFWESARNVVNKTIPFLRIFSDYRFYLGLILLVVGMLSYSAWIRSRT